MKCGLVKETTIAQGRMLCTYAKRMRHTNQTWKKQTPFFCGPSEGPSSISPSSWRRFQILKVEHYNDMAANSVQKVCQVIPELLNSFFLRKPQNSPRRSCISKFKTSNHWSVKPCWRHKNPVGYGTKTFPWTKFLAKPTVDSGAYQFDYRRIDPIREVSQLGAIEWNSKVRDRIKEWSDLRCLNSALRVERRPHQYRNKSPQADVIRINFEFHWFV